MAREQRDAEEERELAELRQRVEELSPTQKEASDNGTVAFAILGALGIVIIAVVLLALLGSQ